MTYPERLAALRREMSKHTIDAYIMASADPHISEYLPDRYHNIAWISGFTGSAGTLVVTQDFAGLWTDSRYFIQAAAQLEDTGFKLVKLKTQGAAEYIDWLADTLPAQAIAGFDGNTMPILIAEQAAHVLSSKQIKIEGTLDLMDAIWAERPSLPMEPAFLLDEAIVGETIESKLERVKTALQKAGASYHLISSLDDISWIFNLRGNDVKCNPVVLSYALFTPDRVKLFIHADKLTAFDTSKLERAGVQLYDYHALQSEIQSLPDGATVWLDPKRTCFQNYTLFPKACRFVKAMNPSTRFKAIKNKTELAHTRETMVKDGVALTRFFYWLENHFDKETLTEITVSEKLLEFRSMQADFVGESFDTIAGYQAHGALPHYKATETSNATLKPSGLLLIDSGGQYRTGTTDITRVISLGDIQQAERVDYTLVLKGTIEGSTALFPKGTRGYQIDAITRKSLWDHLRNYGHGTGHGVGFFLNVHEGPQVFNAASIDIAIEENMITSIEPGLYREEQYGIRIENLVASRMHGENEFGTFMDFETLTLCYIDTTLIDKSLLAQTHIDWLNKYHNEVYQQLSPFLDESEKDWLKQKTQAI